MGNNVFCYIPVLLLRPSKAPITFPLKKKKWQNKPDSNPSEEAETPKVRVCWWWECQSQPGEPVCGDGDAELVCSQHPSVQAGSELRVWIMLLIPRGWNWNWWFSQQLSFTQWQNRLQKALYVQLLCHRQWLCKFLSAFVDFTYRYLQPEKCETFPVNKPVVLKHESLGLWIF